MSESSKATPLTYAAWWNSLPQAVRELRPGRGDDYAAWLGGLSEEAASLAHRQAQLGAARLEDKAARYGVVIVHSGEFPVVKLAKTPEQLARLLSSLEGQDVCVACFHGNFLPVTTGPVRHLLVGKRAYVVPRRGDSVVVTRPLDDLLDDLVIQEDGFLGPEELANSDAQQDGGASDD